jgi:hypothetical protein
MTLVEYAKSLDEGDIRRPVIEMFARSSDVMSTLPIETLTGPIYEGYRQAALPTLAFRGINETSTSGIGRLSPFQEATFILDHDMDVDRAIVDRYGPERRAQEEAMAAAQAGRLWIDTFLKGDNTTNPRTFNGLQKRAGWFSRLIDNSGGTSGGSALSLYQLDNAIKNTRNPTHLIVTRDLMPRFIQAARNTSISGFVIQSWDDVGTPKMSYAGLPILWGYPRDDQGVILPLTEVAPGGGGAVTTSIYVVSFSDQGVRGLQLKPMHVADVGLLPDQITYRMHLSWDCGLVDEHKYCFTRLCGITNAAFVA